MGCDDAERMGSLFRYGESDEGAAIPGDHIFTAFFDVPAVFFPDFRESGVKKGCFDSMDSMEDRGRPSNEVNQVFTDFLRCFRFFQLHYFLWFTFLW